MSEHTTSIRQEKCNHCNTSFEYDIDNQLETTYIQECNGTVEIMKYTICPQCKSRIITEVFCNNFRQTFL